MRPVLIVAALVLLVLLSGTAAKTSTAVPSAPAPSAPALADDRQGEVDAVGRWFVTHACDPPDTEPVVTPHCRMSGRLVNIRTGEERAVPMFPALRALDPANHIVVLRTAVAELRFRPVSWDWAHLLWAE